MLNKMERMNKLNAAGVDTRKYFTVDLDNGTKIQLIIDENGNVAKVEDDPIAKEIITDGYVRNSKLHRRFVMGQMFHMLNYKSYDGKDSGYNGCLKRMYGFQYTFEMMLEEVRVLSKLEVRDRETFLERSHFFTKEVITDVMCDYVDKLKKYIDKLPDHKCKGIPYKRIKGANIFNEDLNKKIYGSMASKIWKVKYARNYTEIYKILSEFMSKKNFIKLPFDTPKSKVWIDAFKGEGAYYTLRNLCLFNNCDLVEQDGLVSRGIGADKRLKAILGDYKGEGWRMFALMKRVIEYNKFDYNKVVNGR